jgi:glycosyltransferase involved in cell wall biosynthesis
MAAETSRFRQDHGLADDDYVVGVCGILRREKGHEDLLRAVEAARTAGTPVRCLIIGDGPMRARIESTITQLGLGAHVRITGLLADVRLAIACCDVIAVPSHNETFSIAALESMAMGKPLIMSDVGGAAELVEHGKNGLLYKREDIDGLSYHIRRLADRDRRDAFGGASLAKVNSQYSLRHMVEAYEGLLSMLCPVQAGAGG